MAIKDSGSRRKFSSGAVRDINESKGRCDLLPLAEVARLLNDDPVIYNIDEYVRTGNTTSLNQAISIFAYQHFGDLITAILEVSQHYSDGCEKYGERNWEKGIDLHCYIDSGVRHYLKHMRGDTDEPHHRAFLWNMLGALWTHRNLPDLIDLPFVEGTQYGTASTIREAE
jgi:hypothetical protein